MSSRPSWATVCATADWASVRSVMSAATTSAVPPAVSISAARSSSRSLRRTTSATAAPCSASCRAVAAPIPLLAPVTRATVPVSLEDIRVVSSCRWAEWAVGRLSGVVVRQRAGQVAVGVGLGEQKVGLLLESGDGVGAGGPAQRRLVGVGELDEGVGELGGVAALLAVHALPAG